jgi:hypothetical protein
MQANNARGALIHSKKSFILKEQTKLYEPTDSNDLTRRRWRAEQIERSKKTQVNRSSARRCR